LILPFLDSEEADALYGRYRFDEPWDGPNNRKLLDTRLRCYECPSEESEEPRTSYLAVVGPQTLWPGDGCTRKDEVADGTSRTVAVVEVVDTGIHWIEPRDLHVVQMAPRINPAAGQGVSSRHYEGAQVLHADGCASYVAETISPEELWALVTIAGGERIEDGVHR
jgi:hypothetical protein